MSEQKDTPKQPETASPEGDYMLARQEGYNKTGGTYERIYDSRLGRAYHRRRCELLDDAITAHFGGSGPLDILEIGCGPGLTLEYMCERTRHRIVGFDFASTMIGRASIRTARLANRPTLMVANAMELPFADGSLDVVYATRFIHQFRHEDKVRIAREISRVLRPGGLVLLEVYARAFNLLNYYVRLGEADIYPTLDLHLVHYPSTREVREITGGDYRIKGLRFFGDRLINRILGYRVFCSLNALLATVPGLRLLMNEHWLIYSPRGEAAARLRVTPEANCSVLDELVRCPKCHGTLTQADAVPTLNCEACKLSYPVTDGIPNLLSHEALPLGHDVSTGHET